MCGWLGRWVYRRAVLRDRATVAALRSAALAFLHDRATEAALRAAVHGACGGSIWLRDHLAGDDEELLRALQLAFTEADYGLAGSRDAGCDVAARLRHYWLGDGRRVGR